MNIVTQKLLQQELEVDQFNIDGVPENSKLAKISQLYAKAFAGDPWNEYKVCPKGHYFGVEQSELMTCTKPKCNKDLKLAYPEKETAVYIAKELSKADASLVIFEDRRQQVLAAGWGYACTIEELQDKYKSPEMKKKVIEKLTQAAEKAQKVFYISEIMVDKALQQRGKATEITKCLLEKAESLNLVSVMRTRSDSPMVRIADKMQMSQLMGIGEDTDNPNRVLYIKV